MATYYIIKPINGFFIADNETIKQMNENQKLNGNGRTSKWVAHKKYSDM